MSVISIVADITAKEPWRHDLVGTLRTLADNIEAGDHGDVVRLVYVIRSVGLPPIIGGAGASATPSQSFLDLHAGAAELLSMTHPERV